MPAEPHLSAPPLTAPAHGRWRDLLASDGPAPDPDDAPAADTAGVQLLASALLWAPGRVSLDPAGASPAADLWRRLGLDDPLGAVPVMEGGRLVALRPGPTA